MQGRFLLLVVFHVVAASVLTSSNATDLPNSLPGGVKTTYSIEKTSVDTATVEKGSTVVVHATGIVKQTGKKFWSTKDAGQQPFEYKAGVGGVIKGWYIPSHHVLVTSRQNTGVPFGFSSVCNNV